MSETIGVTQISWTQRDHPCLHIVQEAAFTSRAMPDELDHTIPAHARQEPVEISHYLRWCKRTGVFLELPVDLLLQVERLHNHPIQRSALSNLLQKQLQHVSAG